MLNPFRKHPELIVHGSTPFNAEPPAERLRASFVTPQDLLYVRSHGNIPKIDAESHRVAVAGLVDRATALSLEDVTANFEPRTVRAVMECELYGPSRAILGQAAPSVVPTGPERRSPTC